MRISDWSSDVFSSDLSQRLRLRQLFDRARVELEGAIGLLAAVARRLEEAGAQRRQNAVEIAPDDAVFVEVGHRVELRLNGGDALGAACFRRLLLPRVEGSEKEIHAIRSEGGRGGNEGGKTGRAG